MDVPPASHPVKTLLTLSNSRIAINAIRLVNPGLAPRPMVADIPADLAAESRFSISSVGSQSSQIST